MQLESCDLLAHLLDPARNDKVRESHIHNTKENHYAVRKDNWVLIDAKSGNISSVPDWFDKENGYESNPYDAALYDLDRDISQRNNLIMDHPEKAAELRALLKKTIERGCSAPRLDKTWF